MRTRVWRIAMFSLFIFGLGCVGCAKRPTSTPSIPPPTRFADESAVYADAAATATSVLICIPRPITTEVVAVVDLQDVILHTSCSLTATPTSVAPTDTI